MQYKCNNKIAKDGGDTVECGNLVKMDLNLLEVKPHFTEEHTNKIELSDKMGIVMRYPTFKMISEDTDENKTESKTE
jgi:hypothetical protein